jgi:putative SOS response-associated peptidase YedK
MINARAESLAEKPSWRDSLRTQRCIILADGYYEWRTAGKEKTPMYFHLADDRAFGLAGLWDRWYGGESPLETCTVITTAAGSRTSPYHHRMPVVLTEDAAVAWLETWRRERDLLSLLTAYEGDDLEVYEVTRHVNNPANEDAECIRPAD